MKTWYGLLKIIDGLTKCIKVLTSKSTWWGAETIHLKCYTNTWLHYYGHFSIFVKLIRHKQKCVTTKGEAPDAMNLPCLTYVCTCYFKASFINFYLLLFSFWKLNFKIWVVITIHFMQHKEFILLNEKDQGEKVSINGLPIQIIFLKTVYS